MIRLILTLLFLSTANAQSVLDIISLDYGNHCGAVNYSANEPMDKLDACCLIHDRELGTLKKASKDLAMTNANYKLCYCIKNKTSKNGEFEHDFYRKKALMACSVANSIAGQMIIDSAGTRAVKASIQIQEFFDYWFGE